MELKSLILKLLKKVLISLVIKLLKYLEAKNLYL